MWQCNGSNNCPFYLIDHQNLKLCSVKTLLRGQKDELQARTKYLPTTYLMKNSYLRNSQKSTVKTKMVLLENKKKASKDFSLKSM